MSFPCQYNDIKLFVEQNPKLDITINILAQYEKNIYFMAQFGRGKNVINLLAVRTTKKQRENASKQKYVKGHFLLILDLDIFLTKYYNRKNSSKYKKMWCNRYGAT